MFLFDDPPTMQPMRAGAEADRLPAAACRAVRAQNQPREARPLVIAATMVLLRNDQRCCMSAQQKAGKLHGVRPDAEERERLSPLIRAGTRPAHGRVTARLIHETAWLGCHHA
jgi:hypothetical protein